MQDAGLTVIAEADNGRDAIDLAAHFRPDVVIMDIVMANVDGLSATRAIVERAPTVRILLLTASDDVDLGMVGLRAGAAGHQVKGGPVDRGSSTPCVRMAAGEPVVGPELTWRLIDSLRALPVGGQGVRPVAASSPRASGRSSTSCARDARSTRSPTSSSSRATPCARTSSGSCASSAPTPRPRRSRSPTASGPTFAATGGEAPDEV